MLLLETNENRSLDFIKTVHMTPIYLARQQKKAISFNQTEMYSFKTKNENP